MKHSFSLEGLLRRRLIVVSGKGGVGKTTVSLALGLLAAKHGKKALVAEVNSEEQIAHLLERPVIGYEETEILPNLWSLNVQPRKAFAEYVLMQIKFKSLYKAVFENRFVRHFVEATPGLSDLMCIGKIYELVQRYDVVIVDAPATGHSIALFEIPSIVSRAVKIGPLQTESDKIDHMLHDSEKTCMTLVTLPEEMPVMEGLEMSRTLSEKLSLPMGPVFLNQFHAPLLHAKEEAELREFRKKQGDREPLWKAVDLRINRAKMSSYYEEILKKQKEAQPLVRLPFLYATRFGLNEIKAVANWIEGAST